MDSLSLPIDERVARELRNNAVMIAATALAAAELAELSPAAGSERFQKTLRNLFDDYSILLDLATDRVATATAQDEIDESYSEFVLGVGPGVEELRYQVSLLRVQTQGALAAAEPCGAIVGC